MAATRLSLAFLAVVLASAACAASEDAPDAGVPVADASAEPLDAGGDAGQQGEGASDVATDGAGSLTVSAVISPNPNMVVSAFVDVTAPGASEVTVRHGDDASYGFATNPTPVDAQGHAHVVLIGLLPGATTHLEVTARASDGATGTTGDLTFDAAEAPASLGLPDGYDFSTDDGTATGYVLGAFFTEAGRNALMLDRHGRTMWYQPIPPGPIGVTIGVFDRLANGHFILAQPSTGQYDEIDLSGELVRHWAVGASDSTIGLDGHDFLVLPDGHAAGIGWQTHPFDSAAVFNGGTPNATRIDGELLDLDPAGPVRLVWTSYPDVLPYELIPDPDLGIDLTDVQFAHVNAVSLAPDGNLLVSCRALSQILKIDRATGAVLWRLGGKRSDFTFQGDPQNGFTLQHDPRFTAGGRLRVFDNGNAETPQETRVVEYELDETAKVAHWKWEYRHQPPIYTLAGGSARDLPGGRMLVQFTTKATSVEIDPSGTVHWEMHSSGSPAYRLEYAPTLYP